MTILASSTLAQVVRFGLVGVVATIVHSAIFLGLATSCATNALIANLLAFSVAVCVSYFGHSCWTFRYVRESRSVFYRFAVTSLIGLALNSAVVLVVVEWCRQPEVYAVPFMVLLVPAVVFTISKKWVFPRAAGDHVVSLRERDDTIADSLRKIVGFLWVTLCAPCPLWFVMLAGGLIGAVYALWYLPPSFFLGGADFWRHGDPGAHVAALRAFIADSWHFPLLKTTMLNFPEGAIVAFADVIPIAALPAKVLAAFLPEGFHYFGFWILWSYILQGAAGALLVYVLGHRSLPAGLAAGALLVMSPSLMFRVNAHTALTTHGYLLLAFTLYYLAINHRIRFRTVCWAFLLLTILALLTHPYLFAMVFSFFCACLVDVALREGCWRRSARAGIAAVGVLVVLMLFCGYIDLSRGVLTGGGGFGFNSMNFFAPLAGGRFLDLPFLHDQSGAFGLLPMPFDATGGQFEGYNHLGFGVVLALLIVVVLRAGWVFRLPVSYPACFFVLFGFVVYALSSVAYVGPHILWAVELPPPLRSLAAQFRASGRVFWPVGDLLTIIALVGLFRLRRPFVVVSLVVVVLLLQFFDTAPLRTTTAGVTAAGMSVESRLPEKDWKRLLSGANAVYMLPAFGCGADPFREIVPVQRLVAESKVPFSTGLLARGFGDCDSKNAVVAAGLTEGAVYVFLGRFYSPAAVYKVTGSAVDDWCRSFDWGTVCRPGAGSEIWQAMEPGSFMPVSLAAERSGLPSEAGPE